MTNELGEVLLLDTDLFFVVKVADTLKHAGYTVRTVRSERDYLEALDSRHPIAILVNTAARGVDYTRALAAARALGVPAIAYGPHVDVAAQRAARDAGATIVVSNSRLAADLPALVARAARHAGTPRSSARQQDGAPDAPAPDS